MARPKGSKDKIQKQYVLPEGVVYGEGNPERFTKQTKLNLVDVKFGPFVASLHDLGRACGSTHPESVKARRAKTNLEKYGTENPGANKEVAAKRRETMVRRYGVANALESPEFLKKSQETLMKSHGVKTPMESDKIKNRLKEVFTEKYGVDNPAKAMSTRILPNGKNVKEYCRENNVPDTMAYILFNSYGAEQCQNWIDNYKETQSCLEKLFQSLVPEAERFEHVPEGIKHYRPDFKLKNIFIDVDGLMYHSELHKAQNYHSKKREVYTAAGYKLLQFRQDELCLKQEIVRSMVLSKAGMIGKSIFARDCEVRKLSQKESDEFLNKTHLMGASRGATSIGLFCSNILVSCMTYKKIEHNGIEIVRFSNDLFTSVVGGFSKLLEHAISQTSPRYVQSFVDLRYGDGESLLTTGFELIKTHISFKWTDGVKTFHRLHCRANMDDRMLSEREYADELKLKKIYDAGQSLFVKKLFV